eukprot:TRINITY_DN9614_c0_g1_i1.p1 TRINITY_DN9614_c0_g1~~TRINITY_DN9614_c0_g1_i1.p1  ORF type:complete len:388 (-),score=70.92 TRINITY_DN9614_c0_g1_i1:65-1228(-)
MFAALQKLDAYPKTLDDYRIRTHAGALISIFSGIIILLLVISEISFFLTTDVHSQLLVDTTRDQMLTINVDVIFPNIPCAYLSLDVMDVAGGAQFDVQHLIYKKRLNSDGSPIGVEEVAVLEGELETRKKDREDTAALTQKEPGCGSCYGAESADFPCCKTCEDVREAYRRRSWAFTNPSGIAQCVSENWVQKMQEQKNEGCEMYGSLIVSKVAGNFHFAPGKSFQRDHLHMHDLLALQQEEYNVSHRIVRLSFGQEYPGLISPLDGVSKTQVEHGNAMFQYFVKIVPTTYINIDGYEIQTNQFSVTEHLRQTAKESQHPILPGVFFMYDLSPIMVVYTEASPPFAHLLTSLCAIIGGVFTVAGLIDSFVYHGSRELKKKIAIGKAS